jgi:hypothetical protein
MFRTYGIVFIAWHIETGMFVAIKKFKQDDDDEYVSQFKLRLKLILLLGEKDCSQRD